MPRHGPQGSEHGGVDASGFAGSLPFETTSFVGRVAELTAIRNLLQSGARLITLTGVGGVGKSRLALHAAHQLRSVVAEQAYYVDLTAVRHGELVSPAVMRAFGVEPLPGVDPTRSLLNTIASRREVLVVLDNCDHVESACRDLLSALLTGAPSVTVFSTCRAPLHVAGEWTLPITPLLDTATETREPDAVRLFMDRAQAVNPYFTDTTHDAGDVAVLCRRLDGLPLAIELAARRMRTLSINQLSARLEDRFALLKDSSGYGPERHRSLTAVLDVSYDQCSSGERHLWMRASVFAAGGTLEAFESVCAGGPVERDSVLDLVDGLVQRAVLVRHETTDGSRFRMLETVREYGLRKLEETAEEGLVSSDEINSRHCEFYLALVRRAEREWFGPLQRQWSDRLHAELPDLRATLEFCMASGDESSPGAVELISGLWPLWIACGSLHEGRLWSTRVLRPGREPSASLAKAFWVAGWIDLLEGTVDAADAWLRASIDCARDLEDAGALAVATGLTGAVAGFAGDLETALARYEEAVVINEQTTDVAGRAILLYQLAEMHCVSGNLKEAVDSAQECRRLTEPLGEKWCTSYAIWVEALAMYLAGDHARSTELSITAMELKLELRDRLGQLLVGELLAWNAAAEGRYKQAAMLLGAFEHLWDAVGCRLMGFQGLVHHHDRAAAQARQFLSRDELDETGRQVAALTEVEVVDIALGKIPDPVPSPTVPARPDLSSADRFRRPESILSNRELEVARLVAEGLTNRQIARRLVISQRTAETHVANLLSKSGLQRRSQVGGWLTAHEFGG